MRTGRPSSTLLAPKQVIPHLMVERFNKATGKIEQAGFFVRHATLKEIEEIVRIYNAVMEMPYEKGLIITPDKIESRLNKDPATVLVGVLQEKGEPPRMVGIINRIVIDLKSLQMIPPTHRELTGDDTWKPHDPMGNTCVCPWVATDPLYGRGWKGEFDGRQLSLGQILVRAAGVASESPRQRAKGMVAYSRPEGLRRYIESFYKDDKTNTRFEFPEPGTIIFEIMREGKLKKMVLKTDRSGVFYYGTNNTVMRPTELLLRNYAHAQDAKGRLIDHAYRMHYGNGAELDFDLVFDKAADDGDAFGIRSCFPYRRPYYSSQ